MEKQTKIIIAAVVVVVIIIATVIIKKRMEQAKSDAEADKNALKEFQQIQTVPTLGGGQGVLTDTGQVDQWGNMVYEGEVKFR